MDGIFIAFHNTSQLLGFQYVPLGDMDAGLFGSSGVGDRIFRMCVGLLDKVMRAIQECSPEQVCCVSLIVQHSHSKLPPSLAVLFSTTLQINPGFECGSNL